jgi:Holliday junction resolvase RusA-like endonuclease
MYHREGPRLRAWRSEVIDRFREAVGETPGWPILSGPVRVDAVFAFARPKAHRRRDGSIRPEAPLLHVSRPDADKCGRSLGDALTAAGAWADDSQVAEWRITKQYAAGAPYTVVTVGDAR